MSDMFGALAKRIIINEDARKIASEREYDSEYCHSCRTVKSAGGDDNVKLCAIHASVPKRIASLEAELTAMRQHSNQLRFDVQSAQCERDDLATELADLRSQLEKRDAELAATRNALLICDCADGQAAVNKQLKAQNEELAGALEVALPTMFSDQRDAATALLARRGKA